MDEIKEIKDKDGHLFLFRHIDKNDDAALGDYFVSLSDKTKSRFGPHPLTKEFAALLCKSIGKDRADRYILIEHITGKIAGYFILQYELPRHDIDRYYEYGVYLVPGLDPLFAPSIGDDFQNKGLASRVMSFIIAYTGKKGARRIVLMGGTQATNAIAIAFYEKHGFKKYGEFQTEMNNYDMMLTLVEE